jgi:hypothetical protein
MYKICVTVAQSLKKTRSRKEQAFMIRLRDMGYLGVVARFSNLGYFPLMANHEHGANIAPDTAPEQVALLSASISHTGLSGTF